MVRTGGNINFCSCGHCVYKMLNVQPRMVKTAVPEVRTLGLYRRGQLTPLSVVKNCIQVYFLIMTCVYVFARMQANYYGHLHFSINSHHQGRCVAIALSGRL